MPSPLSVKTYGPSAVKNALSSPRQSIACYSTRAETCYTRDGGLAAFGKTTEQNKGRHVGAAGGIINNARPILRRRVPRCAPAGVHCQRRRRPRESGGQSRDKRWIPSRTPRTMSARHSCGPLVRKKSARSKTKARTFLVFVAGKSKELGRIRSGGIVC